MTQEKIFLDILKSNLNYDPETGIFTWKISVSNVRKGDVAGNSSLGYIRIRLNDKYYYAHRLAWLYMKETWPQYQIDHINGVKYDNRICNLRDITPSENNKNIKKARSHNKTGFLGVSKVGERYVAHINLDGVNTHLGVFDTPELAHSTYLEVKRAYHASCTI